mmetsp:Transcript_40701/g.110020  ORF Transcript_40701/g.110020 Transcript_40701/m.110020 type:complete len:135 (-) Transcript_40701:179-583(-)
MDEAQKFQKAVEEIQNRVQSWTLPVEKRVTQCALDCYGKFSEYQQVHKCVDGCQQDMQHISKKITGEFQALQSSVQACQQSCIKRLEPRMEEARGDQTAQQGLMKEYEEGVGRCIKDAVPLLPDMEARIKAHLK